MNKQRKVLVTITYNEMGIIIDTKTEEVPERLTDDDFETIRIHLNAYKEKLCNQQRWEEAEEYQRIIDRFMAFASAQPEKPEQPESAKEYCEVIAWMPLPKWTPLPKLYEERRTDG